MRQLTEFYERLITFAYHQGPHGPHITRYSMYRALKERLASEDASGKRAIVISGSDYLARLLGLRKADRLALNYPEFTLENLALLSDSCDFIVSDQVIEHCQDIGDVANETMRVLKPGGWFVHTTCFMNVVHGAPSDFWRFTPAGLASLFRSAEEIAAEGWGNRVATILMESGKRLLPVPEDPNNPIHQLAIQNEPDWPISTWILGRKPASLSRHVPTIDTRKAEPRSYSFNPRPAKFGLVACARNEAPYLLEWIAHHRVLGFEQITIYDNESNDASFDILKPLSDAGVINAIYWQPAPTQNKQVGAYNDARQRLRTLTEWCLYLDLDEYLTLDDGRTLNSILPDNPDVSAVGIPWRVFGSSGRAHREAGLTVERFVRAAAENNAHVKSLIRLRDARYINVHIPELASGRLIDTDGREIPYSTRGKLDWIANGPARINHYFCRSFEEFECKRARGRGAVAANELNDRRPADIYRSMDRNDIEMKDALRLVPAVVDEISRLRELIRK